MSFRSSSTEVISNRIDWADRTKGIGAILVILAHTLLGYSWLGDYIDTFRTTIFFFISGYFFSIIKYNNFPMFLKKKTKTILFPYFIFCIASYLYYILRYSFSSNEYYKDLSLYQQFFGIFYSAGTTQWMDFNLPLWFFTCLFVVQIMFYFLKKAIKTSTPLVIILIILSLVGYADGIWSPYRLPWGIDVALTAIVFFGFGHILNPLIQSILSKPVLIKMLLAVVLFIPNLINDPLMNLNMKLHGYYFDFYIEAFSGIGFCILISSMFRSKVLNYLGKNSLIITAGHIPMLNISKKIIEHVGFISNYYAIEIGKALLAILLTIPFIYLIDKYPFILGKGTKQSKHSPHVETGFTIAGDSS